jgi:hypothetical protein
MARTVHDLLIEMSNEQEDKARKKREAEREQDGINFPLCHDGEDY